VETKEAVRLDDLLSVPGVDAALIGPTDLSLALGVGGQMEHPTLVAAIEATMAACARHKVVPAIHTNDVAMTAGGWRECGWSASTVVGCSRSCQERDRDYSFPLGGRHRQHLADLLFLSPVAQPVGTVLLRGFAVAMTRVRSSVVSFATRSH
jgi:hypothetical protein